MKMNVFPVPPQLVIIGSALHRFSILLFGYFIPALSSVKAVVRKDSQAYHQWCLYWLILHLFITIFSPFLHLTLHPIFQIIAILWLSLPQYQGASVVYERLVVPWVDQYESTVDEVVDEAHRGARRWVWSRFGSFAWLLIGEGGSLAEGVLTVIMGIIGCAEGQPQNSQDHIPLKTSNSTNSNPPRHSIKEALSQSSSLFEVDDVSNSSFDPTGTFVRDFVSMLEQGLYVFATVEEEEVSSCCANVEKSGKSHDKHVFEEGFKLGIFSYAKEGRGAFFITPVATGANEWEMADSTPVVLPLDRLKSPQMIGAQGLAFEGLGTTYDNKGNNSIRVEIVLLDGSDRNILLNGLKACLPHIV